MDTPRAETRIRSGIVGHAVGYALGTGEGRPSPEAKKYRDLIGVAYKSYTSGLNERGQYQLIEKTRSLAESPESDKMGYYIYTDIAVRLFDGENPITAYQNIKRDSYIVQFPAKVRKDFHWILQRKIGAYDKISIDPRGGTSNVIKAAIWCLVTTASYKEAVLKATSLQSNGVIAAVTGSLAGIHYGIGAIPIFWLSSIDRMDMILDLAEIVIKSD